MPSKRCQDGMNHRRLINSLIPTRIVVSVLTHRFNGYKRTLLTIIHPETTLRTITLQGITWLQKKVIIQPKT